MSLINLEVKKIIDKDTGDFIGYINTDMPTDEIDSQANELGIYDVEDLISHIEHQGYYADRIYLDEINI